MMATAIAGVIFICAVALGFYEGRNRSRTFYVVVSGLAIMGVSNLAANGPFFTDDPNTWARTYGTGLLQTGVLSVVIHLLPFIIARFVGRKWRGHSRSVKE